MQRNHLLASRLCSRLCKKDSTGCESHPGEIFNKYFSLPSHAHAHHYLCYTKCARENATNMQMRKPAGVNLCRSALPPELNETRGENTKPTFCGLLCCSHHRNGGKHANWIDFSFIFLIRLLYFPLHFFFFFFCLSCLTHSDSVLA